MLQTVPSQASATVVVPVEVPSILATATAITTTIIAIEISGEEIHLKGQRCCKT
jgi:hypothetical protein